MKPNKPIKATLHKANSDISNKERELLQNGGMSEQTANSMIKKMEAKQEAIDEYNKNCGIIDAAFSNLQLVGKSLIVKLHKENYIKNVTYYADGTPLYDSWISQVDGRMHPTEQPKWIDNPLPYVFTGVVVAISPQAELGFEEEVNDLRKQGVKAKAIQVGDIVTLEHFMFADKRFYMDKQKRDFIKNPHEFRITNWEGYVKIHPTMIEAVVMDKEKFLLETSAYAMHKAGLLNYENQLQTIDLENNN